MSMTTNTTLIRTACFLLTLFFTVSCTDHNEEQEKVNTLKLLVNSKSFLSPDESDKYAVMHSIGLFSLDKQANRTSFINNQKAVYNGHKWYFEGNREIRLGNDSITVYAYYPYDPNMQSDEWLRLKTGDTDYMYGFHDIESRGFINSAQPCANIQMVHAMCLLKLDIRPIIEQQGKVGRVSIEGTNQVHPLYETGQINMFTDETGSLQILEGEVDCVIDDTGQKAVIYMIPCYKAEFNICLIVHGKKYVLTMTETDFHAGKIQNFWLDFDVKQEKMFIRDITIEDWVEGGSLDIDTKPIDDTITH